MCCNNFCTGMVVGIAAGTCLGIRLKAKEKKIRRGINRAARNVEHAFDNMTRSNIWIFPKKFPKLP